MTPGFFPLSSHYVPLRKRAHHEILGSPIISSQRSTGSCEVMTVEWRPPEAPTALAAHGSPWDAPVAVTRPLASCRHRCWSGRSGLNENRGRQRREDLRERQSPVATFEAASGKGVGPGADRQGCRGIAPIGVGLPQAWVSGNQHSDPIVAGSPVKPERKLRFLPGNRQRLVAAPCKQGFLLLAQAKQQRGYRELDAAVPPMVEQVAHRGLGTFGGRLKDGT